MKYFLYARKSSESEERQVQSIDDQIHRLQELAKRLGLEILEILTEAKSAKTPESRPIFESMLDRIRAGEAQGILCWEVNRLGRNPICSGKIQWMLQQGVIQCIQTIDKVYQPQDSVLMLYLESGVANEFIINLRKNVNRGMMSKLEKGWFPGRPPEGYLNDPVRKTIVIDPERCVMISRMWKLMLTGNYSPPKILRIANEDWGYRTKYNSLFSRSAIYKMFTNPFYTGVMVWNGKEYPGKHKALVTEEEFEIVQYHLGRKGKPRPKSKEFAYTGTIRCGDCGCIITAEEKTKLIKSTNELKTYCYYRCTRQKPGYRCPQDAVKLEDIENQVDETLAELTILPEFKEFALRHLQDKHATEIEQRNQIYEMQHRTLLNTQRQLDNLISMRCKEMITDEQYFSQKETLQQNINKIEKDLKQTQLRAKNWINTSEDIFDYATTAREKFSHGSLLEKREILRTLGTEFVLHDKKLSIKLEPWFQSIQKNYPDIEKDYIALEPEKNGLLTCESEAMNAIRLRWQAQKDSNPH